MAAPDVPHNVPVPASRMQVRMFIDHYRKHFNRDLERFRVILADLKKIEPSIRNAYKIYSRGDAPDKDELKSANKIRIKFNNHNMPGGKLPASKTEASLFDVPDIVGLTVVVAFPSDIAEVIRVFDAAVDQKKLYAVKLGDSDPNPPFKSKHGRVLASRGYFACHYNFRLPSAYTKAPIIEVQVKTVLHDAWGVKTHDLTYKPVGRIGDDLLTTFNLLGDNLANLDRQSDALRDSIVKTFAIRDRKRRSVQSWVLSNSCAANIDELPDGPDKDDLREVRETISAMSPDTPDTEAQPVLDLLLEKFQVPGLDAASSILLSYLAAKVQRSEYSDRAQESFATREEACSDGLSRLGVRLEAALATFAGSDVAEAIDAAEEALQLAGDIRGAIKDDQKDLYERIRLGLNSDLAYYYADLIGSHEGGGLNATACALDYMRKASGHYPCVGLPATGIESTDAEIAAALKGKHAAQAFSSLDNEAYVRIQTATELSEIRASQERLRYIHSLAPKGLEASIELARDYNDYCARMRYAELERGRVP